MGLALYSIAKISNDLGSCGIGGANRRLTVHDSIRLVKIDGLTHIRGNYGVVLSDFGDAVDLNGQENWNAILFKLARQHDSFRSAPAMSEDDDAGILFFSRRKRAIVVSVQTAQDFLVGLVAVTIFESLNVYARGILLAEMRHQLHGAVY